MEFDEVKVTRNDQPVKTDFTAINTLFLELSQVATAKTNREIALSKEVDRLKRALRKSEQSVEFHARRTENIQNIQRFIPDPHRQAICDILANGSLRYAVRPEQAEIYGAENPTK